MKPTLQLKNTQQLKLTPQLQQAIRLLQLSQAELKLSIENAVAQNPLLEIDENQQDESEFNPEINLNTLENTHTSEIPQENNLDDSLEEGFENTLDDALGDSSENFSSAELSDTELSDLTWENLSRDDKSAFSSEDFSISIQKQVDHTLQDHLLWQLNMARFSDVDYLIATHLIDAIDDSGFLTISFQEIQQVLSPQFIVEEDEIATVLHRLQHFDPPGVGARTIQESLLIQLNQYSPGTPYLSEALTIIQNHLADLEHHRYSHLLKSTGLDEKSLSETLAFIRSLQPRPGNSYGNTRAEYVIPDIIVNKRNGKWITALNNDSVPKVRINKSYQGLQNVDKLTDSFVAQHLQEAHSFLNGLKHRHETLLRVAHDIVSRQQDFFENGPAAMKPLTLQTIAETLDLHESTVSRITTQKFLFCPRGVFELKYFFSSNLETDTGVSCSSTAIKALLKKLIEHENRNAPLSDNALLQTFREQGIHIARRTITKYREELGLGSSHERKEF